MHDVPRKEHVKLLVIDNLLCIQLLIGRRKALETPFLVGYALQTSVTVRNEFLLPALVCVLPFGPCVSRLLLDACYDGFGSSVGFCDRLLTVDECLSCRDGEEEDAHIMGANYCGVGNDSSRWHKPVEVWRVLSHGCRRGLQMSDDGSPTDLDDPKTF